MTIAVFGLSVTSCWGNGHATFWRSVCRALSDRGHRVVFFERDQPFYRQHRDLTELPGHDLYVYDTWDAVRPHAAAAVRHADAAIVTSYCADALPASDLVCDIGRGVRVFYDMDTPVTLDRLARGETVEYLPSRGLRDFDLVLSYAGGAALEALERQLQAQRAVPLYGCVDPARYPPVTDSPWAALSYLGTYADDRAEPFEDLFMETARRTPGEVFLVGGPNYRGVSDWPRNIHYRPHVAQPDHRDFYGAGRFTLNLTRGPMRGWGHCPSARLFEAAALGVPLLTDAWTGLDDFFTPGEDVGLVRSADDVIAWTSASDAERAGLARRARERVLDTCTGAVRAEQLESALTGTRARAAPIAVANR